MYRTATFICKSKTVARDLVIIFNKMYSTQVADVSLLHLYSFLNSLSNHAWIRLPSSQSNSGDSCTRVQFELRHGFQYCLVHTFHNQFSRSTSCRQKQHKVQALSAVSAWRLKSAAHILRHSWSTDTALRHNYTIQNQFDMAALPSCNLFI